MKAIKAAPKRAARRDLFAELSEGVAALAEARHGKRSLRTSAIEYKPRGYADELICLRQRLKRARALVAVYLRTNVRTL